ncbi:glycoside hydrolase family 2 TIM barrel-domain containing protein [Aquimarina agarilytica]|uniref:glycoside hydrolase family 2 TIM barrel-domain containing protein n=1 Tax=Aquimarina agarilytica TaxID=1087449 RepID=UPI000287AE40|nr:glycoside hydrolase family 2 TIM barrel-domain containing protein [Aquimarina agarilytica]
MNLKNSILPILLSFFCFACGQKIKNAKSFDKIINNHWKFIQADIPDAQKNEYDDAEWQTVNLPHDWSISGAFSKDNPSFSRGAWLPTGIAYYRKKIDLSQVKKDQKVFIHFEGAYRNAEVWINGNHLGKRPFGYIPFEYELTPFINFNNENIITVKLDNSEQPGSRWYSGNGIYRNVHLIVKNETYIPTWGVQVTTPKVTEKSANVLVQTTVKNTSKKGIDATYKVELLNAKNEVIATKTKDISLISNSQLKEELLLNVQNPKLWNIDTPHLYTTQVSLLINNTIIDSKKISTGIRNMEYSSEKGFILNGKPLKIKGVCLHHGGGPLGAATKKTTYERQLRILKEMGTNAVRTAHNPFAPEFLDACDKMGMLVMNEAFDEWEVVKEPATFRKNGEKIRIPVTFYAHLFKKWSDKDLSDFVLRDRNHPSIFMWSVGNEIDQMKDESGIEIAKRLVNVVHKYDNRPVTCGVNGYGWDAWPINETVSEMDVPGYNYADPEDYDLEHKNYPNRKMIVTEHTSAQMIANRGEYYPFLNRPQALQANLPIEHKDTHKFLKNRGYYSIGMKAWLAVKERPYIMGEFIWTGWDYLGETIPYPWPARSSTFGVIDLAGFPKDGFYYYQSQWNAKPMLHIFPHWNWKGHEGEKITVNAFSNASEVELFVNGTSLGKKKNNMNSSELLAWETTYQPGELKAIAYTNGKISKTEIIHTALKPTNLDLNVTDSNDITYVEVILKDKNNHFVPTAQSLLNFETQNAKIIGVGNGNNKSHEPFVANYRKAYHGKCVVILEKLDTSKKAILKVTSKEFNKVNEVSF